MTDADGNRTDGGRNTAAERARILAGILCAASDLPAVFAAAAEAEDPEGAAAAISRLRFKAGRGASALGATADDLVGLDKTQVRAVLDLRLHRLTRGQIRGLEADLAEAELKAGISPPTLFA